MTKSLLVDVWQATAQAQPEPTSEDLRKAAALVQQGLQVKGQENSASSSAEPPQPRNTLWSELLE